MFMNILKNDLVKNHLHSFIIHLKTVKFVNKSFYIHNLMFALFIFTNTYSWSYNYAAHEWEIVKVEIKTVN